MPTPRMTFGVAPGEERWHGAAFRALAVEPPRHSASGSSEARQSVCRRGAETGIKNGGAKGILADWADARSKTLGGAPRETRRGRLQEKNAVARASARSAFMSLVPPFLMPVMPGSWRG